ncbi:unnamed protein product [Ranitomeya imitator]|uniref:Fibronectin type-III domain-containing protein n=1 Tax=Ranitomeya imitator TaxID=111125 RepID=A0ABN9LR26_9NEOB|nr:unnamed protein product [Ranitomeya imitator]
MNKEWYQNVLQEQLLPTVQEQFGAQQCLFQHDGAPCHKAKVITKWLMEQNIEILGPWPGNSPDLNPIENLWSIIKRWEDKQKPTNSGKMQALIMQEWTAISQDLVQKLIESMPGRIAEVLKKKGNFTPGIPYYISVNVIYNNSCIRIFSTEAYRQEEVPTAAPNFTCHHLSDRNILVSWEEIPRLHRRGIISHYTIYINSTNTYKCYTVSNGSGNKTISGLLSETVYTIWMTASTRAGKRHHVLLIVPMVVIILLVCGTILCFFDCKTQFWPKIPKPEDKFKKLFMASNVNMWQPHQVSLNPLIAVVEEIEPPPQPPTPPHHQNHHHHQPH